MSAQVQDPGQKSFGENRGVGTESDWAEVGRRYLAYTGEFYLDEKGDKEGRPILMHHMKCSSLPYLLGDTQRRVVEIVDESDERYLILSLDQPIHQNSENPLLARVKWKRLPNNHGSSQP